MLPVFVSAVAFICTHIYQNTPIYHTVTFRSVFSTEPEHIYAVATIQKHIITFCCFFFLQIIFSSVAYAY